MDVIRRVLARFLGRGSNPDPSYFTGTEKLYLASADQFAGMEAVVEAERVEQCRHFFCVIGGMGGLNVLARLDALESITFFDINPASLAVCRLMLDVIRSAEDRDTFISLLYARPFDSTRYTAANQEAFYSLPLSETWREELRSRVEPELFAFHESIYLPYLRDPLANLYEGPSIHCTRLPIYHDAPVDGVMTYPFQDRDSLRRRGLSCTNSFFFGKGWLRSEERYHTVRRHLRSVPVVVEERSIFELRPPARGSGLYASNVLDGDEPEFLSLIERFDWTLLYSPRTGYLRLEYLYPTGREIPLKKVYGRWIRNPHRSCCRLLDAHFDLERQPFLEVVQRPSRDEPYGFRFYQGQVPVDVDDFLAGRLPAGAPTNLIGVHILLGCGVAVERWQAVVRRAVELADTVFVFEHRKACGDWPEWDVDVLDIPGERELDRLLLEIAPGWRKYGAANSRGQTSDPRNLCWIRRRSAEPA